MTLKELRQKKGITQSQLSKMTNINQANISLYELGSEPSLKNAILLEAKFGIKIDWEDNYDKEQIKKDLISLIDMYPINTVLRSIRSERDLKEIITKIKQNELNRL